MAMHLPSRTGKRYVMRLTFAVVCNPTVVLYAPAVHTATRVGHNLIRHKRYLKIRSAIAHRGFLLLIDILPLLRSQITSYEYLFRTTGKNRNISAAALTHSKGKSDEGIMRHMPHQNRNLASVCSKRGGTTNDAFLLGFAQAVEGLLSYATKDLDCTSNPENQMKCIRG